MLAVGLSLFPQASIRADDDSVSATYDNLKPSLALVATFRGDKLQSLGSAFCVSSSSSGSVFVTNRHVVEGGDAYEIVRQFPTPARLSARVLRSGTGLRDIAFLEVTEPNIPHVSIDSTPPKEGDRVGIAGYPHTQLLLGALGLGLTPSVHVGTVNALPASGFYIQFDAQTEPGNSGGPLFDPSTGVVEGIVVLKVGQRESNFAIAAAQLLLVASNAHVSFTLADRTVAAPTPSAAVVETASPKNVTGTYKGLVEDSVAGSGEITFTLSQSGDDVSGTFSSIFAGPRSS